MKRCIPAVLAVLIVAGCSGSPEPATESPQGPVQEAPQPEQQAPAAGNKEASDYLRDQQVEACRCDKCRCNHCKGDSGAKCYCLDRTRYGKTICDCGAKTDGCKCDHCTGQPGGGGCGCRNK